MNYLNYLASYTYKTYDYVLNTLYKKNNDVDDLVLDKDIQNAIHEYKIVKTRYAVNKKIIQSDQKYLEELTINIGVLKDLNNETNDRYIDDWISNLEHRKYILSSDLDILIKSQKVFKEVSIKDKSEDTETITICEICMEKKKDRSLDCGHIFCNSCVQKCDSCPSCRVEIDKNKIRHVFL